MTIEKERLLSLIDFAQQSARLRGKEPVSVVSDHSIFDVYEHQVQGLPGIRLNQIEEESGDEVWLVVERLRETKPPDIQSPILQPWVQSTQSPEQQPKLRTAIAPDDLVAANGGLEDPPVPGAAPRPESDESIILDDYDRAAQVRAEFEIYLDTAWEPWAVAERPRRQTIRIYSKLFTLKQKLEGGIVETQLELVFGAGVGVWRYDGRLVQYPIIGQLVEMSLDPETAEIEIGPRDVDAGIEIDWYASVDNPGVADLEDAAKQYFERADVTSFSPFDRDTFEPLLRTAVTNLDANGAYWPNEVPPEDRTLPAADDHLKITDTWVLFARPRTSNILIQDLEKLKKQAEEAEEFPPPVAAIVTDPDDAAADLVRPSFRGVSTSYHSDSTGSDTTPRDLYFPKPFNAEQESIVELLEVSDGVVVQGPPGTGKTHTIANVICHYLAEGKRVLVTSMKDPALAVLQQQLPGEIQPLAISLLTSERAGMKQFEHAISKIASEVQSLDRSRMAREITHLQESIDACHATLARIDRKIADWAKRNLEKITLETEEIDPQDAARQVVENTGQFEWIPDELGVAPEFAPRFSDEDVSRLRDARRALGVDIDYLDAKLPQLTDFPDSKQLLEVHQDLSKFQILNRQVEGGEVPALADSSQETINLCRQLLAHVEKLRRIRDDVAQANRPWTATMHQWLHRAGQDQLRSILEAVGTELNQAIDARKVFLERPVTAPAGIELDDELAAAIRNLGNGKSPFGIMGVFGKSGQKNQLDSIRVLGSPPGEAESWVHVGEYLASRKTLRQLAIRWNTLASELLLEAVPEEPEGGVKAAENFEVYLKVKAVVGAERELQPASSTVFPNWPHAGEVADDPQRLSELENALKHHITKDRLANVWVSRESFQTVLDGKSGRVVGKIQDFLNEVLGNPDVSDLEMQAAWTACMSELSRVLGLRSSLDTVQEITETVAASGAPEYAKLLRQPIEGAADSLLPGAWRKAWRARRLATYLDSIDAHQELRKLSLDRRQVETDLSRAYHDAVVTRTWLKLAENASDRIRAALQAYLNAIQAMGTGRGKRAIRHRHDARVAAAAANPAVPCWIMPHYRVSESLPAELGCFDLVVIDEASQSDFTALPALLRAKKMLVVGDDKQVSPEGVGVEEEKIKSLMNRFLRDQVPLYRQQMAPISSIYDLFKVVFAGSTVMLKEHFRCAPPIIEYSKREFYNHELRPLRLPTSSEWIDPPLVDVLVEDGYRRGKENPPEARFIVDEIMAIADDPSMSKRSIGVVSLLGHEQALAIWNQLTEELGPDVMERHLILCGDARTFQGNERDIMFLSMVAAPNEVGISLSGRMYDQRFNVAASRAKDRMYLARSIESEELSERDLLRRSLIAHFSTPFAQDEARVAELRSLCESDFEREMYDELTKRGYWVTPQVRVGHYRIDMVVEGHHDLRLAVECDGDRYHGPEKWADDMQRQRVLERAGWVFWRCFASAFIRRRSEVLGDLLTTLAERGIEPIGAEGAPRSIHTEHRRVSAMSEQSEGLDGIDAEEPDDSTSTKSASEVQPVPPEPGVKSGPTVAETKDGEPSGPGEQDSSPEPSQRPDDSNARRVSELLQTVRAMSSSTQDDEVVSGARNPSESEGQERATVSPIEPSAARFPDPTTARPADLVPGLVAFLESEGPMTGQHLFRWFVKAAGGQRVGGRAHKNLNKAIRSALSKGSIEKRDELGTPGYKDQIFRKAGTPPIKVRTRGEREFMEIPPSEIATVMIRLEQDTASLSVEELHRRVLDSFDTTRLTQNIQERLAYVYEKRVTLTK